MTDRDIVQTLTSVSGTYRAEIRRRVDGLLQVHLFRWTKEDLTGHGKPAEFWEPVSTSASITDDLSRAIELGRELLGNHDSG